MRTIEISDLQGVFKTVFELVEDGEAVKVLGRDLLAERTLRTESNSAAEPLFLFCGRQT